MASKTSKKKTFYITTPIYYINDVPHIGHTYCTLACDILTRYKKLKGYDTFFLTGSDENSQKTIEAAQKAGKDTQVYTDEMSEIWKGTWKKLEISNNDFIRTTEKRHHETVLKVFEKIQKKGDIYKGKYKGPYCWKCETFYKESDLQEGLVCPQHLTKCEIIEEENFFFKLSKYQKKLLDHYKNNPDFIQPEYRKREVVSFVEGGLEDISISRVGQKWGIPMPGGPNHVFYVWFDALINYISGIGYGSNDKPKYWPADFHVIGKDIVRFHCVIWPAMLMAAEIDLPKALFVHGFFTINGLKISKSLGNAINPIPIIERFGRDALTYYLFAEFAFGQDGDFSFPSLVGRINTELADDLGNLLSRTVAMTERFSGGLLEKGDFVEEEDGPFQKQAEEILSTMDGHYNRMEYSKILDKVWKLFRLANRYAEHQKPWQLAKDPEKKGRLSQVLYTLAESLRLGSYVIRPMMPSVSQKILDQLGIPYEEGKYEKALKWDGIPKGTQVCKGESLFPKIELKADDPFLAQKKEEVPSAAPEGEKKAGKASAPGEKEVVPTIPFEDFQKVNLVIGKILSCEKVQKSNKLLRLEVDLGTEKRQILSGIAEYYKPEDMVGKKVVILANLPPRKIMGLESQGMLLAASSGGGVKILTVDGDPEAGSKIS